jgi:heme exporter protein A
MSSFTSRPAPLQLQNLECVRGDALVIHAFTLEVGAGSVVQILGANGAGKTTLLRTVAGLSRPTEGSVLWQGMPIEDPASGWRAAMHYVSHHAGVSLTLTVRENLHHAAALGGTADEPALNAALHTFGISDLRDRLAGRLSAGQRQRTALARLLVVPAKVWLLDEPLTALDAAGKQMFETLLLSHVARGGMALAATHQALDLPTGTLRTVELRTLAG